jgi:hypothetical protein
MTTSNVPGAALPVLNLFNSPDNAAIAASICEVALALIVGPISGETSIVLTPSSSSKWSNQKKKYQIYGIVIITLQKTKHFICIKSYNLLSFLQKEFLQQSSVVQSTKSCT